MKDFIRTAAILAAFALASCSAPQYHITGTFMKINDSLKVPRKAVLTSVLTEKADTVDVVDGKFEFSGHCEYPSPYILKITGVNGKSEIFLENMDYHVDFVQEGFFMVKDSITGGNIQETMNDIKAKVARFYSDNGFGKKSSAVTLFPVTSMDDPKLAQTMGEYMKVARMADSLQDALYTQYMDENPKSYLTLYRLTNRPGRMPVDEFLERLSAFDTPEFAYHPSFVEMKEYASKIEHLRIGEKAIDFSMPNISGDTLNFYDICRDNRLTFLYFSFGGCSFSVEPNKDFKRLYEKYHDKGFEIVSVWLENDRKAWENALKNEQLPWIVLSDLKYAKSQVLEDYAVTSLPQVYVVDSQGTILGGRYKKSWELCRIVEEYFKD